MKLKAALRAGVTTMAALSLGMASIAPAQANSDDEGSVYVQCDGRPNTASALGTVARLIAITAVIGLFLPPEETADASKRKEGAEGVAACDAALNGEEQAKDGGRRIELFYGRAIHNMELERWDDAIADLRAAEADQPELIATEAFQRSLALTSLNLEAMALTGKGDYAAAHAKALEAGRKAPYDLMFMLHIYFIIQMSGEWDEPTRQYADQLVKLYPLGLGYRAQLRARAGEFGPAADDFLAVRDMIYSLPEQEAYGIDAKAAVGYLLAGDEAKAHMLYERAKEAAAADLGDATNASSRSSVTEVGDFFNIWERLQKGETLIARTMFAGRSDWKHVATGFVAELSRRIDSASTDEMREQIAIKSGEEILTEFRDMVAAAIVDGGDKSKNRWMVFRNPVPDKDFRKFARNVWRTDKSRYLARKIDEEWDATYLDVSRNGSGLAGTYAFLLHAALMAKAKGKSGFMVMPGQSQAWAHYVRFGNPGDDRITDAALFDADEVITALSPYFPQKTR